MVSCERHHLSRVVTGLSLRTGEQKYFVISGAERPILAYMSTLQRSSKIKRHRKYNKNVSNPHLFYSFYSVFNRM